MVTYYEGLDNEGRNQQRKAMWKSFCCLFIVLIIGIVGISIDILATQHGERNLSNALGWSKTTADIEYSWREMRMDVNRTSSSGDGMDRSKTISYVNATDMTCNFCSNDESDDNYYSDCYCNKMKKVRDSGELYFAFYVSGICLLFLAGFVVSLTSIGRCLCKCKWPMHYAAVVSATLSFICFLVATIVLYKDFIPNLSDVLSYLIAVYFPVVGTWDDDNWDDAEAGPSLACLVTVMVLSFTSIPLIIWDGKAR